MRDHIAVQERNLAKSSVFYFCIHRLNFALAKILRDV